MSVLGVDLGTSGVRAVAFASDGSVVESASQRTTLYRPRPGRVELDPAEVVAAAESVVARVAAGAAAKKDPVEALSFAVLGEAVLPLGPGGAPTARIAVSMDTRGDGATSVIRDHLGDERFTALTGQPLHGMFAAFKIAAGGAGWEDAVAYRCVGDFLTELWTGVAAIDYSQAARTGLFAVDNRSWSAEIIETIAPFAPWLSASALPVPTPGGTVAGTVTASAAARLGLEPGTPVVAGAHDQAAAFLGGGGSTTGDAVISFGSSDCVTVGTSARPLGTRGTGFATYRVDDDLWVTLAGTAAGGWALEWFAGTVGGSVADVFGALSPQPPSLLVLPYLAGSGTLDNDPTARGVIHGLTLETRMPELARAVVEGAGFEFAKIIAALRERGIPVQTIRVTGSGAGNADALRARAEAAGESLAPIDKDASARGAAILAARGADIHAPRLREAPPAAATQRPDPGLRPWYDAQRDRYRALYTATRDLTPPPFPNPAESKETMK